MDYNTIVCLWDGADIACACIFNIEEEVCVIHHAVVGNKYRNHNLLKRMVREGYLRYPYVKWIKFYREFKYGERPARLIPIEQFLKGE